MKKNDKPRIDPPINATDFGVPPIFAERAENFARWAIAQEREACAKVCEDDAFVEQWKGLAEAARRIRARGRNAT
ncbi:hypothetical protein UFOVP1355_9 [uncultured Caudovirales phage]|uniref:Uncharacterized protein n=1 Tax=uncultured Caudovirales phage TaxID=2100421 RepID=A0A6J5S2L5_9CAUD|nr:hypothetical protein UFOVP1355_9 [uncultured Caudovirales phage]